MFCVIILHLLGHGGALKATSTNANFATLWFWEIAAYPAVNCFVLLSGFVGYRSARIYPKISNILSVILSTLFYSLAAFFIYRFVFAQETTLAQFAFSALPILTTQYWFVSAYVGMFLLSPIINFFVYKAERKLLVLASVITLTLTILSMLKDPFAFANGYSTMWFVLLYMLGAIIKKEDVLNKLSVMNGLVCIAIGFSITLGTKLACAFLGSPFSALQNRFISYCSPTVLLMAIGWLTVFSKVKTTPITNKAISFITPSVFSVYLIHDNPFIRELFIANKFTFINAYNPIIASGIILSAALSVFFMCLLIDEIRVVLFKFLRVSQITTALEKKIKAVYAILVKRISA